MMEGRGGFIHPICCQHLGLRTVGLRACFRVTYKLGIPQSSPVSIPVPCVQLILLFLDFQSSLSGPRFKGFPFLK